ncbi:MAG: hypothetical protein JNL97_00750 [Verrucomicrobiales bacterium]|nr:hypothetical protein [Verrucomicrobiales bacterium]
MRRPLAYSRCTRRVLPLWILLALPLLGNVVRSAEPAVDWELVGEPAHPGVGVIRDVTLSSSGEILLPGHYDYDTDLGWSGIRTLLLRYDAGGALLGALPSRGELIESVAIDSNGNAYVTGRVWRPADLGMGTKYQFYIAKYTRDWKLLWERAAGATFASEDYINGGFGIAPDKAGNAYVAGFSHGPARYGGSSFPNSAGGPLLCKYDPDGNLLWVRRGEGIWKSFGDWKSGGGDATSIALAPDGEIVISGRMNVGTARFGAVSISIVGSPVEPEAGGFLAKYAPSGDLRWVKALPPSAFGLNNRAGVVMDREGNLLISGTMIDGRAQLGGTQIALDDSGHLGSFVAKLAPTGDLIWAKAAPIGGLAVDSEGHVYSGISKLDANGNLLWARGVRNATLRIAAPNSKGELIFVGSTREEFELDGHAVTPPADSSGYFVGKTDRSGTVQWVLDPAQGAWTSLDHVLLDPTGGTLIAGRAGAGLFLMRLREPAPVDVGLTFTSTDSRLRLSWPVAFTDFVLETADSLAALRWTAAPGVPVVEDARFVLDLPMRDGAGFFRLRKP